MNLGSLYNGLAKNTRASFKHLRRTTHTHDPLDDARGNAEAMLTMIETMGLISDRTQEHLGTSDIVLIRVRRRLMEALSAFVTSPAMSSWNLQDVVHSFWTSLVATRRFRGFILFGHGLAVEWVYVGAGWTATGRARGI